MAPEDIQSAVDKVAQSNQHILVTERGSMFGYHQLVVDMTSLIQMRQTTYPIILMQPICLKFQVVTETIPVVIAIISFSSLRAPHWQWELMVFLQKFTPTLLKQSPIR